MNYKPIRDTLYTILINRVKKRVIVKVYEIKLHIDSFCKSGQNRSKRVFPREKKGFLKCLHDKTQYYHK